MWNPFKFVEVSLIIAHHMWKHFIWKVSRIFSKVNFVPKLIENITWISKTEAQWAWRVGLNLHLKWEKLDEMAN